MIVLIELHYMAMPVRVLDKARGVNTNIPSNRIDESSLQQCANFLDVIS